MNDDSKQVSRRKLLLILLVTFSMLIGAVLSAFYSFAMKRNGTNPSSFAGTWRRILPEAEEDPHGLGDVIWDLRDDGTARWRRSSGKKLGSAGNTVGYFEWWTDDADGFVVHQYSSASAATRGKLISAILGPQGGRSSATIVEVSEEAFTLRWKDGKKATYRRTEDITLSSAP